MIVIIDYNMGNFAAIKNMLLKLGYDSVVTSNPSVLNQASKIILPGVGSFDFGIENLHKLGLVEIIKKKILIDKTPILGVCLGMQLLTKSSEEGKSNGLGLIDAVTIKFKRDQNKDLKIPNMGWHQIDVKKSDSILKSNFDNQRFYFVHSFHVVCLNNDDILATSEHGGEFVAAFIHNNIYGCQFHPEKSHKYGQEVLKNFAELEEKL
jgi:imidazole glycerol-phosphate synthase subunit HisH